MIRPFVPLLFALALFAGEPLPPLPRAISGQCVGVSNGALLVIGGSYFPKPLFEGGTKTWVDTIYVFTPAAATWKSFRTPRAIGYAACASSEQGVIVAGGGDANTNYREVFRVTWTGELPVVADLPSLPVPLANAAATIVGRNMYVAGGQRLPTSVEASRALFVLNVDRPDAGWKRLDDCPCAGRILPVIGNSGGRLYLASGAELSKASDVAARRTYLRDAWQYQPNGGWKQLPDAPAPLVAAPVLSRDGRIYVFGGDDGEHASRIQELKDKHPGFRREIVAWTPGTGVWSRAGDYRSGLVTTMAIEWSELVVIAGGEDRPGHRSAEVISIPLGKLQ